MNQQEGLRSFELEKRPQIEKGETRKKGEKSYIGKGAEPFLEYQGGVAFHLIR